MKVDGSTVIGRQVSERAMNPLNPLAIAVIRSHVVSSVCVLNSDFSETHGDLCTAVSAEMYWCSSTCNNAVPYWGSADDSACATTGLARNNGGPACGWGADGNGWDDGCGTHRTGERCNADCAPDQGCTIDDCADIAYILGHDDFAGRWQDGALAASTADHFNAAAEELSDTMSDLVMATCDAVETSPFCNGHEYDSMCALSQCETDGNIAVMQAFCNEQGGAAATVFALCGSTFEDQETVASLCAGYSETATSEAIAVRATIVSACANIGFDAATCGTAAAAVATNFPTCDLLVGGGLAVCSGLSSALLPTGGDLVGCTVLANTIGDSVGLASEAVGAFQTAANSDNFAAMCRESGNPISFVVDSCGGIGYEYANEMCSIYAAAEGGDEAKANADVMELICREGGWNDYICDSYRVWINWLQDAGRFLTCNWTAETWGDMCEAVTAEMTWCSSTCNVNVPYFGEDGGGCAAVGIERNEGLELCGWGSSDTSWISGVSGGSRNGWTEACGYHRTGEYCNAGCAEGQGCTPDDCDVLAYIVTSPEWLATEAGTGGGEADCVATGDCSHASITSTSNPIYAGRWHQGSTAAVSQENFNNAAATLSDATMSALHATCDAVGTTASCSGHEFDSLCSMTSCEDDGNIAALTVYCGSNGGPTATVDRMCTSQMADNATIADLCSGFVGTTSSESAAVAATISSVCVNIGFDASDCASVASSTDIPTCADLLAAGSSICPPFAATAAAAFPTCEGLGASLGDSIGMASSAVDAFSYAANTEHVRASCEAAGNPLRHCIDHCMMTSAEYANDMCNIFAAGESGDELLANQDIMQMTCLEIGWPEWGCAGYRWWTEQRQAEGLYTSCDWTPESWAQHCDAACSDHFWCSSSCDNEIPYFAAGGTVEGACDDVGIARNDGFPSSCGWQDDFSAPRCDIAATGTYCDEDCASGQGCNVDDCATIAWVVTDPALDGRWHDAGFSIDTSANGADTYNAAADSLSNDMFDMLISTCATVGTVATCAGHEHESICSQLDCGGDPALCCPAEWDACVSDPSCNVLVGQEQMAAGDCMADALCAPVMSCMVTQDPCGPELLDCLADTDCSALMDADELLEDLCNANAVCNTVLQCMTELDAAAGR